MIGLTLRVGWWSGQWRKGFDAMSMNEPTDPTTDQIFERDLAKAKLTPEEETFVRGISEPPQSENFGCTFCRHLNSEHTIRDGCLNCGCDANPVETDAPPQNNEPWQCQCTEIPMPHPPRQHDWVLKLKKENPRQQFVINAGIVYAVEPDEFLRELNDIGINPEAREDRTDGE